MKRNTVESFWSFVNKCETDKCWEWTGVRSDRGYGKIKYGGKQLRAHRLAYSFAKGPIPPGILVRHSCDNPPCCNPAHLLLGTSQSNIQDRVARGRSSRGESHYAARLNSENVVEIRKNWESGASIASISRKFRVGESTIRHIVQGHSWKDLL